MSDHRLAKAEALRAAGKVLSISYSSLPEHPPEEDKLQVNPSPLRQKSTSREVVHSDLKVLAGVIFFISPCARVQGTRDLGSGVGGQAAPVLAPAQVTASWKTAF